jgi:hypothetical protein
VSSHAEKALGSRGFVTGTPAGHEGTPDRRVGKVDGDCIVDDAAVTARSHGPTIGAGD